MRDKRAGLYTTAKRPIIRGFYGGSKPERAGHYKVHNRRALCVSDGNFEKICAGYDIPPLTTLDKGGNGPDPVEETAKRFEGIASKLKLFTSGRASTTDYDEIKSSGLPRPSVVFFLTSTPQTGPLGTFPPDLLVVKTICDEPLGLHVSIAEKVLEGTIDAGGLVKKPQISPSFEPLTRVYGYAGLLIQRMQLDPKILADDIVNAWSQVKSNPLAPLREGATQVASNGPDALHKVSLSQPEREKLERPLDKGVPIFLQKLHQEVASVFTSDPRRTTPSKKVEEAEDLLTEIGVFWLLGFRWRWCTYRGNPHWYIAGHRKQYGCVRHRDAVQQDRSRHPVEKRP